ncbi:MAG: hypothetical protein OXF25_01050 [Cyanobacteria bacterium MAG CAR3_bin_5]|nr:hypothetical protein [Cyanobacteria bacterium MAG CAR3_bin_5]
MIVKHDPFSHVVNFLNIYPFPWPQDNFLLQLSLFPPWPYPMRFPFLAPFFLTFLPVLGIEPSLGQQGASPDQQSQEVSKEQDQEEANQGASLDQQEGRMSLFGKPTVSIPQVTVPRFEGISVGGISA